MQKNSTIKIKDILFHKHKIHRQYQTEECSQVIPLYLHVEYQKRESGEDEKSDNFLDNLQLHQRE